MTVKRLLMFAAAIAMLVIAGSGCLATPTSAPASDSPGVITIERADPAAGVLVGTYVWNGVHLRFEGIRGEENPAVERMSPNAPRYAVDARVCDAPDYAGGWCFAMSAGGHALNEEGWLQGTTSTPPDSETSLRNLQAGWHLALDLAATGDQLQGLEDVRDAIIRLGRANPPDSWPELNMETQTRTTPQEGVVALALTGANSYTHLFQVWWQPCCYHYDVAQHSGSRTKVVNASNVVISTLDTCNHGPCAGAAGMYLSCSRPFSNRPSWIPITSRCDSPPTSGVACSGYGCCATPYGFWSNQHDCDDDTRLQRDTIIANSLMCVSYCGDPPIAVSAPSCY